MRSIVPRTSRRAAVIAAAVTLTVITACGGQTGAGTAPTTQETAAAGTDVQGCVTNYTAGRDYFPDKSTLKHAKGFTISYHNSYQLVTVDQPSPGQASEKYVFYQCGTPVPELTGDLAGAQAVQIPVTSLFSGSTTHLPLLADLDALPVLKGVSNGSYVTNPEVRQMIADKKIVEYAPNQAINAELVTSSKPDVVMTGGTDDPAYAVLRQAGIPVVANAEWLESSPLGRAEWLKYMAALTGEEAKAGKVFDQIELDYQRVADLAKQSGAPVTVLPGQMYQGNWSMPGGDSYAAALIKDANGAYSWSDVGQTGNVTLSLEEVLGKAKNAEVWIMSTDVKTLDDVTRLDPRYAEFRAFQENKVWSNNAQLNPEGGNDYWERGVTRPDLVLADLVKIMHPDAVPDHELEFYRHVTR